MNTEIFNLSFYGKGGFPYSQVLSMPVKRRAHFIQLLQKAYQQQNRQVKEASDGKSSNNARQITTDDTQMIKNMYQLGKI